MTRKSVAVVVAGAVICLSSITACQSSGHSTDAGSGAGSASAPALPASAGLAAARKKVAMARTEPTRIGATTPLPRAPQRGIKVAFLSCSAAACTPLGRGFTDAAEALGWKPRVITYNSASPGAAVQQAINAGYKYIASTSIQLNQITPQLAQLKAKKIGFFGAYTHDTPQGSTNGLYGVANDQSSDDSLGDLTGAWMVAHSGGKAHAAFVQLPLYPSNLAIGMAEKRALSTDCPSCTFDTVDLTTAQLAAGQAPSAIVTYLKAHSSVNYLSLGFEDLDTGVAAAVKAAGLSNRVTIVGAEGQGLQMQEIASGTEAAWSVRPQNYTMWVVVDWMARLSENVLDAAALKTASGVAFLVDDKSTAAALVTRERGTGNVYAGPVNYQQQFEKLWHVG